MPFVIKSTLKFLLTIYAICVEIIVGVAFTYYLKKTFKLTPIKFGAPSSSKKVCNVENEQYNEKKCSYLSNNYFYFTQIVCLWFAFLSFFLVIAEIGLLFKSNWFYLVSPRIVRGIIYILKGICALGVAADLGIAGGFLEIGGGVIYVIVFL